MATIQDLQFELQRRVILFKSSTNLPDDTLLGFNDDPNNVVNGQTTGETLLYNSPQGTRYQQDDGTQWYKKTMPNTWNQFGSGSTQGTWSGYLTGDARITGTLTANTLSAINSFVLSGESITNWEQILTDNTDNLFLEQASIFYSPSTYSATPTLSSHFQGIDTFLAQLSSDIGSSGTSNGLTVGQSISSPSISADNLFVGNNGVRFYNGTSIYPSTTNEITIPHALSTKSVKMEVDVTINQIDTKQDGGISYRVVQDDETITISNLEQGQTIELNCIPLFQETTKTITLSISTQKRILFDEIGTEQANQVCAANSFLVHKDYVTKVKIQDIGLYITVTSELIYIGAAQQGEFSYSY